jgi:hypothetical protein
MKEFALTSLVISDCMIKKNDEDNLFMKAVHHKSNKGMVFLIEKCDFENSQAGFGAIIFNSSIAFLRSKFQHNCNGGIMIGCSPKPTDLVPDAI